MVQAGGISSAMRRRESDRFSMSSALDTNPFTLAPHDVVEAAINAICEDFLDDAILNVTFEVHRSMKKGLLMLEAGIPEDESRFYQVNAEGLDVFGQAPVKKQHECICPNCSRNLAASRFAPHLEKCMGMGRNSSRIASRRIQNSTRENNSNIVGPGSDDDDDDDWYVDRKRRKRDKNSPRRSRSLKICGVVSEHTGKICTRSMRCSQHSMEQRRAARDQITFGMRGNGIGVNSAAVMRTVQSSSNLHSKSLFLDPDEAQVDNDSMESEACQLTSSWDHDTSNTTSPADSTSTNNSSTTASSSSSSNKKSSSSKSKKKNSKNQKKDNSHSNVILD